MNAESLFLSNQNRVRSGLLPQPPDETSLVYSSVAVCGPSEFYVFGMVIHKPSYYWQSLNLNHCSWSRAQFLYLN